MVFSDYLKNNPSLPLNDVTNKLLVDANSAQQQIFRFLTDSNIPYVDPLPDLKSAVGQSLYSMSAGDMHPGKNGYAVIGKAVVDRLKQLDAEKQPAVPAQ
jgi:hypothetical protein